VAYDFGRVRKRRSRGARGIFLVFASLIFPPSNSNSGQTNAVWLVGP
jgi:hypothetical protein